MAITKVLGIRWIVTLTIVTHLSSCSVMFDPSSSIGSLTVGERSISYTIPQVVGGPSYGPVPRLFAGSCMVVERPRNRSATGAVLAPILLNFAVDSLGKLLQKAGAEHAVAVYDGVPYRYTERRADSSPSPEDSSPPLNCLQFVVGEWNGTGAEPNQNFLAIFAAKLNTSKDELLKAFEDNGIFIRGNPALFLEIAIHGSVDSAYFLMPKAIYYNRSLDTGKGGVERGLLIEFGINRAPSSLASDKSSRGILTIGNLKSGNTALAFQSDDPRVSRSLWIAPPTSTRDAGADTPLNIEMRVVEVRDARPVLSALGAQLVGESGNKIADALRQDFFPTKAERQVEITSRIQALQAYTDAIAKYRTAWDARAKALTDAEGRPDDERAAIEAEQNAVVDAALEAVRLAAMQAGRLEEWKQLTSTK